jgi:hypothetical protein
MKISNRERLLNKIKKIYPRFLYEKCKNCKSFFKNEHMWKFTGGHHDDFFCLTCYPTVESLIYSHLSSQYTDFMVEFGRDSETQRQKRSLCGHCDEPLPDYLPYCTINKYKFHKECFVEIAGNRYL